MGAILAEKGGKRQVKEEESKGMKLGKQKGRQKGMKRNRRIQTGPSANKKARTRTQTKTKTRRQKDKKVNGPKGQKVRRGRKGGKRQVGEQIED